MISVRAIPDRVVVTMAGPMTQMRGELTLEHARTLHAELGELIAGLELGEGRDASLAGLIARLGGAAG